MYTLKLHTCGFMVFAGSGETHNRAEAGDWWSEGVYHLSVCEGSTGQRISEESHPSSETESGEIWSCYWEMLRTAEGKGTRSNWFIILASEAVEDPVWSLFVLFGKQDAQLAKAHSERDSKRGQKEQTTDEKDKLVAHIDLLKRLVGSPSQPFVISEYINIQMMH